jgi:GrpB-like predicted nucleotidyltransferase (UPF0157 family)
VTQTPQKEKIQLVGGQQVLSSEGDFEKMMSFYGGLFDRLTKAVKQTGDLIRYIGFQSPIGENGYLHFFGIEVDRIDNIPDGMVAWSLDDDTRTVRETREGRTAIISQDDITWQWLTSGTDSGRYTGEFTGPLPLEEDNPSDSGPHSFWISANSYVSLQESDPSSDEIDLVDHDPSWSQQFEEMSAWLRDHLGTDVALRIEHYGSTSIPGIPAKPLVDILVEIPSFSAAKPHIIPCFDNETWDYWWHSEHMVFVKREKLMGKRTHHVHIAPKDHRVWDGLAFRDYLRSHTDEREQYAQLKRKLAVDFRNDRERYTRAKTEFVHKVTSKALRNPRK